MSAPLTFAREDEADAETVRAFSEGLDGYNAGFLPGFDLDPRPRHLLARDPDGALQAGARYYVAIEWTFLAWLWVAEPYRHAGVGSHLLEGVETDARSEGCRGVYLDTFSFQAPAFYARQGYAEFGRLADFPKGFDRIWMMKRLS